MGRASRDALGRILATQGGDVTREYYFNDHGAQIDRFTRSLIAAAQGEPAPEDGYAGAYIVDIAADVQKQVPGALDLPEAERHETFRSIGVELMFEHIKRTLHEFGVDFDVYFHENSLFESGAVERAVETLKGSGNLYHEDGAWWLKSTDFGDDKDRVVIKPMATRVHRRRHRLLPGQACPRLRPVHLHARRRPSRLHRPAQGRGGRVRRRPRHTVEVMIGRWSIWSAAASR